MSFDKFFKENNEAYQENLSVFYEDDKSNTKVNSQKCWQLGCVIKFNLFKMLKIEK